VARGPYPAGPAWLQRVREQPRFVPMPTPLPEVQALFAQSR